MSRLFDTFHIGRFRGFENVRLTGCGSTNLLVGVNNSGKSTVLEALAIYNRPFDRSEWMSLLRRREAGSGRGVRIEDLLWLFGRDRSMDDQVPLAMTSLAATGEHPIKSLAARATRITRFEQERIEIAEGEYEDVGPVEEKGVSLAVELTIPGLQTSPVKEVLEFWPDRIFDGTSKPSFYREVRTLTPFSHRIEPAQLKRLSQATQEGWKGEVLDLLRAIDPAILALEILSPEGNQSSLHVRYAGIGLAPLSVLGDGLRRVVSIALAVANLKDGLLLIDEIESAIHVSALETVFPWLTATCKRNGIQLFATTHSLEALDALLEIQANADGDEMTCFRLNRSDHPDRVERLGVDLLRRLRFDRGLDVRQAR